MMSCIIYCSIAVSMSPVASYGKARSPRRTESRRSLLNSKSNGSYEDSTFSDPNSVTESYDTLIPTTPAEFDITGRLSKVDLEDLRAKNLALALLEGLLSALSESMYLSTGRCVVSRIWKGRE